jgi:hypothetical protein
MSATITGHCKECGHALYGYEPQCRVCGHAAGYPNVRRAELEQLTLEQRYQDAVAELSARGCEEVRQRLETMAAAATVVKAEHIAWTSYIFRREDLLFVGYQQLVDAGLRASAQPEDEAKRLQADACLYARYARNILYAALSCNGKGVISYGPSHVQFHEHPIANRTTVCEENVYRLRDQVGPIFGLLPAGHLALLHERHKLCVIKNAAALRPDSTDNELAALILSSNGDHTTDRLLEVHIHSPLSVEAIARIRVFCDDALSADDLRDLELLHTLSSSRQIPIEVV